MRSSKISKLLKLIQNLVQNDLKPNATNIQSGKRPSIKVEPIKDEGQFAFFKSKQKTKDDCSQSINSHENRAIPTEGKTKPRRSSLLQDSFEKIKENLASIKLLHDQDDCDFTSNDYDDNDQEDHDDTSACLPKMFDDGTFEMVDGLIVLLDPIKRRDPDTENNSITAQTA